MPMRQPGSRRRISIVWCGGPMEIAKRLAAASADDSIGANVKAQVFDRVRDKVGTLAEIFWKEVVVAALEFSHHGTIRAAVSEHDRCKEVSAAVNRAVIKAVDAYLSQFSVRARHVALRLRGLPRLLPRSSFEDIAVGPHQLASLGVYEYLHDVLPWRELTRPMQGIWKIARSAGWIVPHERVCWVSERPRLLRTDASARLHCADGPALQYPDGWSVLCLEGRRGAGVDDRASRDRSQPATVSRSIRSRAAQLHDRDHDAGALRQERRRSRACPKTTRGILWRKLWGYRGVTVGSWTAVEVANGTAEADGSRRRYFLRVPSSVRTPREAVAWTYGLSEERYAELDVRT